MHSQRHITPYTAELSRSNPTSLIFLIDQSSSMAEPFGAKPEKPKAEGVADAINRLLQNLVLKCADDDAGGLVEQKFKFPIWFERLAVGRTPMC